MDERFNAWTSHEESTLIDLPRMAMQEDVNKINQKGNVVSSHGAFSFYLVPQYDKPKAIPEPKLDFQAPRLI